MSTSSRASASTLPVLTSLIFLTAAACSSDEPSDPPAGGAGGSSVGSGGSRGGAGGSGGSQAGGSGGGAAGQGGAGGAAAGSGGSPGGAGGAAAGAGGAMGGQGGAMGGQGGGDAGAMDVANPPAERFSFFVTSLEGMRRLSGSQNGFGGDLRYGEANGLAGADKICTELAESSMPGAGAKGWRAFLSAAEGPEGQPVHAIDRLGDGPWYDRLGRIVAMTKADLLNTRPRGADPAIINDLPNEFGVPNRRPDPAQPAVDNHHFLTGSDDEGRLFGPTATCNSWSTTAAAGRPRIGFSWPAGNRQHWISGQNEGGCGAGVNLENTGGSDPSNPIVGSGGGYGGIYCFANVP